MSDMFSKLAPFIQDYIYEHEWTSLREVQVAAFDIFFNTNSHILLSSKTASGKTEAAFLPILTKIYQSKPKSVGVLYISPLKALINDQFKRLNDLLKEADIEVTKWHGDAKTSAKNKILKKPEGIIQITPESLEAMLMGNSENALRLFFDLKYIVIDELHYFMGNERGLQLLCLLERLQNLTNIYPRRVGLSATLGNIEEAQRFLSSGTNENTITPNITDKSYKVKIGVEVFDDQFFENDPALVYKFIYKLTLNKKCLMFSNSKSDVEKKISVLKKIAKQNKTPDVYMVHHANISKNLREESEEKMKIAIDGVIGATNTLELGIDLGDLDRVVQLGSPKTVSSFVQRLGRSGRRDNPAEMMIVFDGLLNSTEDSNYIYGNINFEFLKAISIVNLYSFDKFIETFEQSRFSYSLLYHQTMSYIYSKNSVKPKELSEYILSLSPFSKISKEDYKKLLKFMIEQNQVELTKDGEFILGLKGERRVNSFDFYSIFSTSSVYTVKNNGQEIGTIDVPFRLGDKFLLAGVTWKVISVNDEKRILNVEREKGNTKATWLSSYDSVVDINIMRKIKEILISDEEFKYLSKKAKLVLESYRKKAKESGILNNNIIKESEGIYLLFYFLGTTESKTLSILLKKYGIKNSIVYVKGLPLYIKVEFNGDEISLKIKINEMINTDIDKTELLKHLDSTCIVKNKYNFNVPLELLQKQYLEDIIDIKKLKLWIVSDK